MVDIDNQTGLPKLPEGLSWEVTKEYHEVYKVHFVLVSIVRTVNIFFPNEFKIFGITLKSKSRGYKTIDKQTVVSGMVLSPDRPVDRNDPADIFNSPKGKNARGEYFYALTDTMDLTRHMVFETALLVADTLEKREMSESLFGSYPPNRLFGGPDS